MLAFGGCPPHAGREYDGSIVDWVKHCYGLAAHWISLPEVGYVD